MPPQSSGGAINLRGESNGELPVLLRGTTAYVAGADRTDIVDTVTGQVTGIVRPQRPAFLFDREFVDASPVHAPVLADLGGRPGVLVPFTVAVAGQGTTPGHDAIELHAVETETGATAWVTVIDLPRTTALTYTEVATDRPDFATVIGVHETTALLSDGQDTVYAVDLRTRQVLWQRPAFASAVLAGNTVVGNAATATSPSASAPARITGLDLVTGAERWALPDAGWHRLFSAGTQRVVAAVGPQNGDDYFAVLDTANGNPVTLANPPRNSTSSHLDCRYDQSAVVVCFEALTSDWSFAIDPSTGATLWELEDSSARLAPTVTAVWHGAVYGQTANGPVVLDARTGTDRNAAPGTAPYVVNEYIGVAKIPDKLGLFACPAIG